MTTCILPPSINRTEWVDCLEDASQVTPSPRKIGAIGAFVLECHSVVAEGLAALIENEADLTVVGHAASLNELGRRPMHDAPDVVLMDASLAGGTDAAVGAAIRWLWPEAKVILLTRQDGVAARMAALQVGASALIHMSCPADELLDAIRNVARGETMFKPKDVAELLDSQRRCESIAGSVTAREREVLHLMASGMSSLEIAGRLGISYATVRSHIRNLMGKLGAHSKLEAIVKARNLALLQ